MRIQSDSGGPSPDPVVVKALKAYHPGLYPVWKKFLFHNKTGRWYRDGNGHPIGPYIRWCIYLEQGGEQLFCFRVEDPKGSPLPLDMRVVQRIKSDVSYKLGLQKTAEMLAEQREIEKTKRKTQFDDRHQDLFKANKKLISGVFEGDNIHKPARNLKRDPKITSYSKQGNRGTRKETIPITAKERGWELPDPLQEEQRHG